MTRQTVHSLLVILKEKKKMAELVKIFDTTLRDGEQSPGADDEYC